MFDIKVPAVGESISEVTVAQWLKADGEYVNEGDLLCEIESDKASFELPAEKSGILKLGAAAGDVIAVGESIGSIDETANASAGKAAAPGKPAASPLRETPALRESPAAAETAAGQDPLPVLVPAVGESIAEVTIASWLKADGELVNEGDLICEIESDKASFELPAEKTGLLHHRVAAGEVVAIGAVIAEIKPGAVAAARQVAQPSSPAPAANGSSATRISPVAANILADKGIDPTGISGTGPGGKITKEDAIRAEKTTPAPSMAAQPEKKAPASPAPAASPSAATAGKREERRERMSSLRRTISRRLVEVKNQTAMLTTFNELDMSGMIHTRTLYKEAFQEKHGVKLGFMSFFTRAVCIALSEWPAVNARLEDDHIVYHDYVDISIAVSTPRGLVVPVIRNAESLSLAGIENAILDLAGKARDGKLTIEEMTGGTMTITNGGVFGSLMSTPIINAPQSAILGMHKTEDRPVVVKGEIVIRPMMYLALSYDHRIIDGRESVSFLVRVKELLEDPARMLLEV